MTLVQVTLSNNDRLSLEVKAMQEFMDQFQYGDSSVVLQAKDGTYFRAESVIAFKPIGEIK